MNYRIDHLAFRTFDRNKSVKFFKEALGYKEQAEFTIYFDEEKKETALCTALEPSSTNQLSPWIMHCDKFDIDYHKPPECFVSEGSEGSIVYNWCKSHGPGLHHIALQVPEDKTVEQEMQKWLELGWAEEFSSDVIHCDSLSQVFTKPSNIIGIVFELIKRKEHGFCLTSVKSLMQASKGD